MIKSNGFDPTKLLTTGSTPPKAARQYSGFFYDDGGNVGDITVNYTFSLSGDFLPGESNAGEIEFLAVYDPLSDSEYADYGSELTNPSFFICGAAEDKIYQMIEKYKNGGLPDNVLSFSPVKDMGERVYFAAAANMNGGYVLCFYAMDRGKTNINNYIGVLYDESLSGSALEKKLMKELEEAVRSYREEIAPK